MIAMDKHTKAAIPCLLLAIVIVANFTSFHIYAEDVARHSRNILDIAKRDLYTFNKFFEWLNKTYLLHRYSINSFNYKDIENKSPYIISDVFSNPSLSLFVGGLQLRILKRFAYGSASIDLADVSNLLLNMTRKLGLHTNKIRCSDPLSKLLINTFYAKGFCKYSLSDLDDFVLLISTLGIDVSSDYMALVLGKVYIVRMASQRRIIHKEVLQNIVSKLIYEESIVTGLFLVDFVRSTNIDVVDFSIIEPLSETYIGKGNLSNGILTLEDVELILNSIARLISMLKQENIDVSPRNIIAIINYVLSLDIDKVKTILESINTGEYPSTHSIDIPLGEEQRYEVINESITWNISITSPTEYSENEYEELQTPSTLVGEINASDEEAEYVYLDLHSSSEFSSFDNELEKYVEEVNKVNIVMATTLDSLFISKPSEEAQNIVISSGSSSSIRLTYFLYLYLAYTSLVIALTTIIFAILWRFRMKNLGFEFSIDKKIKGLSSAKKYSDPFFVMFWELMYKIASILRIKVSGSETHREVFKRIMDELSDQDAQSRYKELVAMKSQLRDIVKGYEVLRYSRDTYNKNQWLAYIRKLIRFVGKRVA